MTPAPLERAASLVNHAKYLGVPLREFALLVTVEEGFQLIDWLLSDEGPNLNKSLIESDALVARATGNPWTVLDNFELMGLAIKRYVEFAPSGSALN